jgi:exodeoxyribonuclease VII small subunit
MRLPWGSRTTEQASYTECIDEPGFDPASSPGCGPPSPTDLPSTTWPRHVITTAAMTDTPELSFEEIVKRLEEIAKQLESGQPKLEESLRLFEEGVRLSRAGGKQLDDAERRLEVLLEGDKVAAFAPAANGE